MLGGGVASSRAVVDVMGRVVSLLGERVWWTCRDLRCSWSWKGESS